MSRFIKISKSMLALVLTMSLFLSCGIIAFAGNTELPDSILGSDTNIVGPTGDPALSTRRSAPALLSLAALQAKFPDGKYWNHVGGSNNPDGWTNTPCTHHGNCGYYPNNCTCNSFDNAIQCMGFAMKVSYDAFGSSSRGWAQRYTLDGLKPGDVVRYATHSIFVTAVFGDSITYGDANSSNASCIIRWNKTTTKAAILSKGLQYVSIAPRTLMPSAGGSGAITKSGLVDGGIYYLKNEHQGKYLDVKDSAAYNGAKLQVHPFNGSLAQQWKVLANSNGTYKIVSMVNQAYTLDVTEGLSASGTRLQLWENNGNVNSQFQFTDTLGGPRRIAPAYASTMPLGIYDGADANMKDIAVQIEPTALLDSGQYWTFEPVEGIYYIKNRQYDKYLDVKDFQTYNGAELQAHPFNGSTAQQWRLGRNSDGTYKITTAVNQNYSLDVANGVDADGARVQLWENNTNINSKFKLTTMKGAWWIRGAFSSTRGLDVDAESSIKVHLWNLQMNSLNQQWYFIPVSIS